MSLTLERSTTPTASYQEVYDWLYAQAEKLGLQIFVLSEDEKMQSGLLTLPVYVEGALSIYDSVLKLQKLEDTWNDLEPRPQPSLFLVSVKNPVQRAIWNRVDKAVERKMKAANALADAVDEAEERRALAELRAARLEEKQAEAENEALSSRESVAQELA